MPQPLAESLTPEARVLLAHAEAVLAEAGAAAYVVGGALRDALLGVPVADPDLAVDGDAPALANAIAARAGGVPVVLDPLRGIARVVTQGDGSQAYLDIARLQGGPSDSHSKSPPTRARGTLRRAQGERVGEPADEQVMGSLLDADLRRRDFTVNAIALPLAGWRDPGWQTRLIDPLGGVADVARRRLRLASPTALADDPARLLRAVRIGEHRALTIDSELEASLLVSAPLLQRVAPDRLREEFLLLLESPDPTHALHELDRLGLLMELFPEMGPMRNCLQPPEHHWDVLEHTLQAVGFAHRLIERQGLAPEILAGAPWDAPLAQRFREVLAQGHGRATFLKLAALFHDIGKPATKSFEPSGRIRFFGHSELGAATAKTVMERLHFSGKAIRHVALMVAEHLRPGQLAQNDELPSRRAIWRYYRDLEDAAIDTLFLSLADYLAARGPHLELQRWTRHATMCAFVLRYESPRGEAKKPRLITGHDLIKRFALEPGPLLGRLLQAIDQAAGAGEITTREDAFDLAQEMMATDRQAARRGGASSNAQDGT